MGDEATMPTRTSKRVKEVKRQIGTQQPQQKTEEDLKALCSF
ncbi:hypothetical protein EVA_14834 [gut metagenome]|uniref:Uncharacterized protein n=1 Tax=gut metagenome TaxID=749906 RepID=J9GCF3_9ZZZZ